MFPRFFMWIVAAFIAIQMYIGYRTLRFIRGIDEDIVATRPVELPREVRVAPEHAAVYAPRSSYADQHQPGRTRKVETKTSDLQEEAARLKQQQQTANPNSSRGGDLAVPSRQTHSIGSFLEQNNVNMISK
jgi:hypothetical protein